MSFQPMGRVAYQGAPGAFGEIAALETGAGKPLPCREFADVLTALASGAATHAVLPVENSTIGPIEPVVRLLEKLAPGAVHKVGEVTVPVRHCLIRPAGSPETPIERVLSHPAALAQCTKFFRRHPELQPVAVFDTAGALDEAAGQAGVAVIAAERAALLRGATILENGLEDEPGNATRFVVLVVGEGAAPGRRP